MALRLDNLDERTRKLMEDEVAFDVTRGTLYLSPRLNQRGLSEYESLLREAIRSGDDDSFASSLRSSGLLNPTEERRNPKGGTSIVKVPVTAPETLAEGEFNRYYARGLCVRAIEDGINELVIYRAKEVKNPRPESAARIGQRIDARALLDDLRAHPGIDTSLGIPPGPNSGLSVRLL